ncbi:MAG TPA: hypothetical protein VMS55_20655, partial [Myxococcota bacterium]|nr:hypothetical protein [Myxococcota bacterium]
VVAGDFNGDGVVNMQDIEDAARSLYPDALEAKRIRVTGSDVYGVTDVPDPDTLPRVGLLELDSNTTLECDPDVVLKGWDETVPGQYGPVIANRDLYAGNRSIHIRGCTIDGGAPQRSFPNPVGFRAGVYFDGCDDCSVENSTIRNTFHACLYTRHGTQNLSRRNLYENCGSRFLDDSQITQNQPCIYAFAESGRTTRGVSSVDDVMHGCAAPGFNPRIADTTAHLSGLEFSGGVVEDTVMPAQGIYWGCFTLRTAEGLSVARNITCRRTAGFFTDWAGGAAGSYDHIATTHDAQVDGAVFESMKRAVWLGPWSTNVKLTDLSIESEETGIVIAPPNRGLRVEHATICAARGGVLFDSEQGAPNGVTPDDPQETTTLSDLEITCSNPSGAAPVYDGIEIRGGGSQHLDLVDAVVSGPTRYDVFVHDPAQTGTPFELEIDGGRFEGTIRAADDAAIEIHGGSLRRLEASESASITLYGRNFVAEANGSPVLMGYGDLLPGFAGRIAGVLADGSALDTLASNGGPASSIRLSPKP